MVSLSIELSEYNIWYIPNGTLKSHVLADFLEEFSSSIDEETSTYGFYKWTTP